MRMMERVSQSGGGYHILPYGDNDGHRLAEVLEAITDLAPSVIVYNDLSMDGSSYLLAQCVDHRLTIPLCQLFIKKCMYAVNILQVSTCASASVDNEQWLDFGTSND